MKKLMVVVPFVAAVTLVACGIYTGDVPIYWKFLFGGLLSFVVTWVGVMVTT